MDKKPDRRTIFFTQGIAFFVFSGTLLFIANLSFFFHIRSTPIWFWVGLGFGIFYLYFALKPDIKLVFLSIVFFIGSIIVFTIIGTNLYDFSFDGQSYHQDAIFELKNGWNPIYNYPEFHSAMKTWVCHYPIGAEMIQASFYSLTGKIESGKALNFIFLLASFLVTFSAFPNKIKPYNRFFYSGLITANPVVITQLATYYLDGIVASLLLTLLLILFFFPMMNIGKRLTLTLLIAGILISVKFTSIAYVGILILTGIIYHLWKIKRLRLFSFKIIVKNNKIGIFYFSLAVIFCLTTLFHPYITNFQKKGHPFYPLMGKGKIEIMIQNAPLGFDSMNRWEKFPVSLFAKSRNIGAGFSSEKPEWKIPFSIDIDEFIVSGGFDTRLGGFGPLFSGLFLLALTGLFFLRNKNPYRSRAIWISIAILFSTVINPEFWWARYAPQLYFFIYIPLIFIHSNLHNSIKFFYRIFYIFTILANLSIVTISAIGHQLYERQKLQKMVHAIQSSKKVVYLKEGSFRSFAWRLEELGIRFEKVGEQDLSNLQEFKFSNSDAILYY